MKLFLAAIMLLIAVQAQAIETYWTLPAGACQGYTCRVQLEGDYAILDEFRNSLTLYSDENKIIIVACMEQASIDAFLDETDGLPLTPETAALLRVRNYYLGKLYSDIFKRYQELFGTYNVINEDGSESVFPIVQDKHFGGCE